MAEKTAGIDNGIKKLRHYQHVYIYTFSEPDQTSVPNYYYFFLHTVRVVSKKKSTTNIAAIHTTYHLLQSF